MFQDTRKFGSTSVLQEITILDATQFADGEAQGGLTGLVFNTGSLTCYYHRDTAAAAVQVNLVTMTVGTFTSSGFKEVDATNMPGRYQLCLPDAAFLTGAKSVSVTLKGAANMVQVDLLIRLTSFDPHDAVRGGLTALPNVNAEAAGGLYTRGTGAGQINQTNNGQIDSNAARLGGTTQTGRDVGTSVLLSSGTGTGQLSLSSGRALVQVPITKNVAFTAFTFDMVDSSGNAATGLTITATRSIDGAAFSACANAASEISNGSYKITLSAADLNGNVIELRFTATGAKDAKITLFPTI